MENILQTLFFILFAGIVGSFAYQMFRFGGIKAAMFGARIDHTVGEVAGERRWPVGAALKVHVLRRETAEKLNWRGVHSKKLYELRNDAYYPICIAGKTARCHYFRSH